jgi:Protein of unknown function (DUF3618)
MTDGPAVSGVVVADNEQRLRQQISQTREQLGDTVAQLVAKADIKRQVKVRKDELAGRAKVKRDELAGRAKMKRDQLTSRAKAGANPDAMRRTGRQGVSAARERPAPLIAGVSTVGLGSLALLFWRRRRSKKR